MKIFEFIKINEQAASMLFGGTLALCAPVAALVFGIYSYIIIIAAVLFSSAIFSNFSRFSFFLVSVLILFKNFVILLTYNSIDIQEEFIDNRVYALSIDFFLLMLVFLFSMRNMTFLEAARSKVIFFYLILVFIYFLLGLMSAGSISAITYLRVYIVPIIAFVIGYSVGWGFYKKSCLYLVFAYLFYLLLSLAPGFWELFRIDSFFDIKYGMGRSNLGVGYLEDVDTSIFGYKIVRLIGPQLAPVSAGYFLLFVCSFFLAVRWRWAAFFLLIPIFFSSKGSFVAAIFLFLVSFVSRKKTVVGIALLFYFSALIYMSSFRGLTSGYTHLQGLLGGFGTMIANPLGNGVGFGGTQSSVKGIEYGGESGLGFMLSHFGVVGLLMYSLFLFYLFKNGTGEYLRSNRILYLSLLIVFINGFLQEEALFMISLWWFFSWFGAMRSRLIGGRDAIA